MKALNILPQSWTPEYTSENTEGTIHIAINEKFIFNIDFDDHYSAILYSDYQVSPTCTCSTYSTCTCTYTTCTCTYSTCSVLVIFLCCENNQYMFTESVNIDVHVH